jgi:hypothetical protein
MKSPLAFARGLLDGSGKVEEHKALYIHFVRNRIGCYLDYCFFSGFVEPLPHAAPEAPLQQPPDLPSAAVAPPLLQQPAAWLPLLPHEAPAACSFAWGAEPAAGASVVPPFTWPTRALRWEVAAAVLPCGASSFFFSTVSEVAFPGLPAASVWAFTPNAMNAKALKIRNFFMSNLDG